MNKLLTSRFLSIAFIALISCTFAAQQALAIPALRRPFTVTQPDGSIVTLIKVGDESSHFTIDLKGNLVTGDECSGYFFGEIDSRGAVVSTGIPATSDADKRFDASILIPKALKLRTNLITQSFSRAFNASTTDTKDPNFRMVFNDFPASGKIKTLVVLVEFSDLKFNIENPQKFFDRMLNEENFSENGCIGSARQYFLQSSDNQFDPEFVVTGPVTLPQEFSYYGKNDFYGNEYNTVEMVTEACKACDDLVNFADFDYNNDGMVDNIYFFYAGYGEADNPISTQYLNTIWPHAADINTHYGVTLKLDGKLINHYACSNERRGVYSDFPGQTVGYGIFCHEFSHVLGLPDLYDPSYRTDSKGNPIYYTPGSWSIMDYGGYNHDGCVPPLYGAFERFSLGWIKPRPFGATKEYAIAPIHEKNDAFIVYTEVPSEFFLFENRQQKGFDLYLPSHGMLAWHIDFNQTRWNLNSCNAQDHQHVDLIEANGLSGSLTNPYEEADRRHGEPFPGSQGVTAFSANTTPALLSWANHSTIISLENIREEDGIIKLNAQNIENPTDIDPNGIDNIEDEPTDIRIRTAYHSIIIEGSIGNVVDLTGRAIGIVRPEKPFETAAGIYIVHTAGKIVKVIVR